MRKPMMTISDLEASAAGKINQEAIRKLKGPKKKNEPAPPVMWMWGQLAAWSLKSGFAVVRELEFHQERRWRFDFAIPDKMIALEYEGIFSNKSGHTTKTGYTKDVEKYDEAAALGWTVIRFTAKDYRTVIERLEQQLEL